MAVDVTNEPSLELGTPQLLFRGQYWRASFEDVIDYDVSPEGDRFLMIQDEEPLEPARIHVVVNWDEELERLVPTARP